MDEQAQIELRGSVEDVTFYRRIPASQCWI